MTTELLQRRRLVVTAPTEEAANEKGLEEAVKVYGDLLVTGVLEVTAHEPNGSGEPRWMVTVDTIPKRRKQQHMSEPETTLKIGPRDGLNYLEWAARDLDLNTAQPCHHCGGTGELSGKIKSGAIARTLTGSTATKGGPSLIRVTADPPLSTLQRVAHLLDYTLDQAGVWIQQLHRAATKGT